MAGSELLIVRDLGVRFETADGEVVAAEQVSFTVTAGETLAIVGESGSGKSQSALAVMGLLAANGRASGSARLFLQSADPVELIGLPRPALNRLRGRHMGMVFQEPMTSLDPLTRVGEQIAMSLRHHQRLDRTAARERAFELLEMVAIPSARQRLDAYPHELSGGQRQRVVIALAIANRPSLLIADEPTTALDVTIQAQILHLLSDLRRQLGMGLILITHDLSIVRRIADRVVVMRSGRIVESGTTATVFSAPEHPYTQMLLAAEPRGRKTPPSPESPVAIEGRALDVTYRQRGSWLGGGGLEVHALKGVNIAVRRGETVGVVGESGSGKSTLGRALLRLVPSAGLVRLEDRDLTPLSREEIRPLRRTLQVVFQDPYGSLSPRLTIGAIVGEGLLVHEPLLEVRERERRAEAALAEVGIEPAWRNRYPHELSGGQRQRIAIARAMVLKPRVVILDEPTSALDRSVQSQIIELLRELQVRHGLAYVFISHDLAVVRAMADRIIVMKDGRIVESGLTAALIAAPRDAYTRELLAAAALAPHVAM